MKTIAFLLLFALSLSLFAGTNLISDGDFENGLGAWKEYAFGEVQRGYGLNGNSGLRVARQEGDAYGCNSYSVELQPNVSYVMRTMVRTENVQNGTATLAIEFYSAEGQWLPQSIYRPGVQGDTDWTLLEQKFTVPDIPNVKTHALVYLSKDATGAAYFDDVTLSPLDIPPEVQLVYPTQGQCDTSVSLARFSVVQLGNVIGDKVFEGMSAKVTVSQYGKPPMENYIPVTGHAVEVPLYDIAAGELNLHAELVDASGNFLAKTDTVLNVVENTAAKAPKGACIIDEYGRAIVDGKPFLPIGLYMTETNQEGDLELIYDSDFNCIIAYGSPTMQLHGSQTTGIPGILESLNALDAHGIKSIFSLKDLYDLPRYKPVMELFAKTLGPGTGDEQVTKLVTALKNHPAILAWYDNDEAPLTERPVIAARRQLINRLDPYHPVWGVHDNAMEAAHHGSTCDIMGIDPYPISTKEISDQERTMELVEAAKASGQPCWAVPQIFNWGIYPYKDRVPAEYEAWKQPTLEQMRGILFMELIYGCRGFVFYSFFDLKIYDLKREGFNGADYATREDFLKNWEEVKVLAATLKNFSPWILSKQGPLPADFQVTEGKAHAAIFRPDNFNMPIVLVANVGPDNLKATLTLPADFPPMRAFYGHAVEVTPGTWEFSGEDVWGEFLSPREQ